MFTVHVQRVCSEGVLRGCVTLPGLEAKLAFSHDTPSLPPCANDGCTPLRDAAVRIYL